MYSIFILENKIIIYIAFIIFVNKIQLVFLEYLFMVYIKILLKYYFVKILVPDIIVIFKLIKLR